jgi:hypothetical protein
LSSFHEKVTRDLSAFVKAERQTSRIPSALILAGNILIVLYLMIGNNIAGHTRLFAQIKEQLKNVIKGPVIVITAAEITNLQSLLRKIVAGCLQVPIFDGDEEDLKTEVYHCIPCAYLEPQVAWQITL